MLTTWQGFVSVHRVFSCLRRWCASIHVELVHRGGSRFPTEPGRRRHPARTPRQTIRGCTSVQASTTCHPAPSGLIVEALCPHPATAVRCRRPECVSAAHYRQRSRTRLPAVPHRLTSGRLSCTVARCISPPDNGASPIRAPMSTPAPRSSRRPAAHGSPGAFDVSGRSVDSGSKLRVSSFRRRSCCLTPPPAPRGRLSAVVEARSG